MSKELMGTLSPLYGMATGHGLFGQEVGLLPAIAKNMRGKKEAERLLQAGKEGEEEGKAPRMKKGGMVKSSASKRADGCAKKGKTKGRMV
jgi:hypothetical protein